MSRPIELRDYLTSRPELVPSYETLRTLLRPGEVAMVTEYQGDGWPDYRVWLRFPSGRIMGKPGSLLGIAIANLVKKLANAGRVPR